VPLKQVLGINKGIMGVATSGNLDDHKEAVEGALFMTQQVRQQAAARAKGDHDHDHDHDHKHEHKHEGVHQHGHDHDEECDDPTCTDPAHDHSHEEKCVDPTCTDPTHDHSHEEKCDDPVCTDPTHKHSHDHNHDHKHGEECADPTCTDPTHDHHHHEHGKSASQTTAEERFRIGTCIYSQRRPFHPDRFAQLLEEISQSPYIELTNAIAGTRPTEDRDAKLDQVRASLVVTYRTRGEEA
jgi:hypothetical protein